MNEGRMCYSCNDVDHYSTHLFANRAVEVIRSHAEKHRYQQIGGKTAVKPLFLYFPLQDTHGPVDVPSLYKDAAANEIKDNLRREIAGKLAAVDEAIKNVTDALQVPALVEQWTHFIVKHQHPEEVLKFTSTRALHDVIHTGGGHAREYPNSLHYRQRWPYCACSQGSR